MLVAALPAAIEFVLEIESIADVLKVLLLPAANLDESDLSQNSIRVIKSESNCAIGKTIEVTSMLYFNAKILTFSLVPGKRIYPIWRGLRMLVRSMLINLTFASS